MVEFKQRITSGKTIPGIKDFYIAMASGLWSSVIDRVWALWDDDGFIGKLAIGQDGERSEAQHSDDVELCDVIPKATLSQSKNFCMWELEHTVGLPMLFAKLLSHDETAKEEVSMNVTISHNGMRTQPFREATPREQARRGRLCVGCVRALCLRLSCFVD